MDWGTLKTDIANYLIRSDIDTVVPNLINQALHKVERLYNWKHMESKTSGTLSSSSDSIAVPTKYKVVKSFFVTADNKQRELEKIDYSGMIIRYPYGSTAKNIPKCFSILQNDGFFYLRPYPDGAYSYELITYNYSNDLSDANTSNWFMTNAWEVLLYGALMKGEPYLKNPNDMPIWEKFYAETINELIGVSIEEDTSGSLQSATSTMMVV